eukprot:9897747-Karenia_brevis.AAC.1
MAELAKNLTKKNIAWSIENPQNSLMWCTEGLRALEDWLQEQGVFKAVTYQACMHGGQRPKRCKLWYFGLDLTSLEVYCDKSHTHLPWGLADGSSEEMFATGEERRYPILFCKRLAALVMKQLAPELEDSISGKPATMAQPRRGQNVIVPEYKLRTSVPATKFPRALKGDIITVAEGAAKVLSVNDNGGLASGLTTLDVGVLWSKPEFIAEAMGVVHPFDRQIRIPSRVAAALHDITSEPPSSTVHFRISMLEHYSEVAARLEEQERVLHKQLHPDVERVVADKRILLFRQMLRDIQYDDESVAEYLVSGVKVVGDLEAVGIWKEESRPAACSLKSLWEGAKLAQKKMQESRKPGRLDAEIWEKTLTEVSEGILEGPLESA